MTDVVKPVWVEFRWPNGAMAKWPDECIHERYIGSWQAPFDEASVSGAIGWLESAAQSDDLSGIYGIGEYKDPIYIRVYPR